MWYSATQAGSNSHITNTEIALGFQDILIGVEMMDPAQLIYFEPYHLDWKSGTLWRRGQRVSLRPQVLSLLTYLAERPGQIIPAQELRHHIWQGNHISNSVFRVCIYELRQALQDDPDTPRYLETIRGKGYRFCAPVSISGESPPSRPPAIIGRPQELRQLQVCLTQARQGKRQLVLVSGEAGMGKTALVDTFLASLADDADLLIAQGYSIEHTGPVEAYLPVLEALGSLGRGPFGAQFTRVLSQAAPTWFRQLPMLMPKAERDRYPLDVPASTRARMIRELVDALDLLSAEHLVVVVLEDLHWSDPSTIDLLGAVMRRREAAQLLLLGTYRPLETQVHDHPLLDLLQTCHSLGQEPEIHLTPLPLESIHAFLEHRLEGAVDKGLTEVMHERSDGNPLFLERLVDYVRQHEMLIDADGTWQLLDHHRVDRALPNGVRQLLSRQIAQFPDEVQDVLKVANAAGMHVTTALVAADAGAEAEWIEDALQWAATRSYFLQTQGLETWPDGTISSAYRFRHVLYRQVLYEHLSAERCLKLHRRIGERLERAYHDDVEPVVGRLAYHFAQGHDVPRAVQYLHRASVGAMRRLAANEAIAHLNTALELLPDLPTEYDRLQVEYGLQTTLGSALIAARGAAAGLEANIVYRRAYQLGKIVSDIDELFPTLVGLENMVRARADYVYAQHLSGHLLNYAHMSQAPIHLASAYRALSINHAMQGQFLTARHYAESCRRFHIDPQSLRDCPTYNLDPILTCQLWYAIVLLELGYPEQALALGRANVSRAHDLRDAFSMTQALVSVVYISRYCQPATVAYEAAQALVTHTTQQEQLVWERVAMVFFVLAMARLGHATEGLNQLESVLDTFRALGGARVFNSFKCVG